MSLTTEKFIIKAKEKYGNLHDYSNSIYIGTNESIKILCKKQGTYIHDRPKLLNELLEL